jgi:methionyl-tRNA synthetase
MNLQCPHCKEEIELDECDECATEVFVSDSSDEVCGVCGMTFCPSHVKPEAHSCLDDED